jgi:hypothetical protein
MNSKARVIRVVGMIFLVWLYFCTGRELDTRLHGVWRCPSENYKDSYIEIRPQTIIFGNDQDETETGTITGVKHEKMPDKTWILCTVKYENKDALQYELQFYFNSHEADTLVFKNQEDLIWTRVGSNKASVSQSESEEPTSVPGIRPKKNKRGPTRE